MNKLVMILLMLSLSFAGGTQRIDKAPEGKKKVVIIRVYDVNGELLLEREIN